jgi:hypothetical protein
MAVTDVTYSYVDESKETTRIALSLPAILADGTNWDSVISDVGSNLKLLGTALSTMTLCDEFKSQVSIVIAKSAPSYPTDAAAQREYVARFTYSDNVTGTLYRFDLPGPGDIFIAGTDEVDLSSVGGLAFKAAFEANAVSPVGNAVTLLRGVRQGRRG